MLGWAIFRYHSATGLKVNAVRDDSILLLSLPFLVINARRETLVPNRYKQPAIVGAGCFAKELLVEHISRNMIHHDRIGIR